MKMLECIRMLMDVNRVTQTRMARWRSVSVNSIGVMLRGNDIRCCVAADMLGYMGYEIIVRERGTKRRADEILIDMGESVSTPERIEQLKQDRQERRSREAHYASAAEELRKKYPNGMGVNQLIVYFKKQNSLIHKYFDGYFFHKRVPIEDVIRIMKENKL